MGSALIVVDVQTDFCEGGSLAVTGGAAVAAGISAHLAGERDRYALVAASLDWHTAGTDNGGHIALPPAVPDYVDSWPVHCIGGTVGAQTHEALDVAAVDVFIRKGQGVPAYSAFEGIAEPARTLGQVLREHGVTAVAICGLATDYCVAATARSALEAGFSVTVLSDLVAAVHPDATAGVFDALTAAGARISEAGGTR